MKVQTFLIVNSRGTTRTTKNRPDLKMDEIALGLTIELPPSIFARPQLEATITVSPEAAQRPMLTADAIDAVKQSIEQGVGMEVSIRVIDDSSEQPLAVAPLNYLPRAPGSQSRKRRRRRASASPTCADWPRVATPTRSWPSGSLTS